MPTGYLGVIGSRVSQALPFLRFATVHVAFLGAYSIPAETNISLNKFGLPRMSNNLEKEKKISMN